MKCAGCMKPIKDLNAVKCTLSACEKYFCTLCINVSSLSTERKKVWVCPDCCAIQKKGGDNSLTPVRSGSDNVTTRKKTDSTGSDISQLTEQLRQITIQFSTVMTKLEDVTQSLSHSNERLDDMMLKWNAADERLKYLEKRDIEVVTLQATVMQLQKELKVQAQQNLRNEVEIVGIPENLSENLYHTVLVAAKKLGVEMQDSDIDWVSRVGPRRPPITTALPEDGATMPRPVVVRLLRRTKRDQLLKATKSRKNISSTDLEVAGVPRRVFFNERLTKENRVLFRDTRYRAKQLGFKFCWCNQGAIYVRQLEGKSAVLIQSHKDLDRLLPPAATSANQVVT